MRKGWKAMAAGGVLAAALSAGTVAGVVQAQQPGTPAPTATPRASQGAAVAGAAQGQQRSDDFINDLARNLGITPERLREGMKQTALQQVDKAQAAGNLTPEQATRAREAINSGTGRPFGFGRGFGGPGMGERMGGVGRVAGDKLADFFGVTEDQLRTERRDKSLAEIAAAHGKNREQLSQFIISTAQQESATAVQSGRVTQQQADAMLTRLRENIDRMLDQKRGDDNGGPGGRRGR